MTQCKVSLKPFFTYTGGKYRLAPKYPAPAHDLIVEPFAGSAGYSLRHYERDVLLVDLDPRVATLWEYLIEASPSDVRSLPLFDGSWETTDDLHSLSDGEAMLIRGWLNKGTFGKRPSAWMRTGLYPNQFWGEATRERVASQVPLIKHWRIQHGSYESAPDVEATWFIDPPYQVAGVCYAHGSQKIDYAALARWCKEREGQVLACENVGADWLPFRPFADAKAMHGGQRTGVSREAIWP